MSHKHDYNTYNLNCWDWSHPIKSIKRAYYRITKGYCANDVYDWYAYISALIHGNFNFLANHHSGVPIEYEDNPEEYEKKLVEIAKIIKDATNYEEVYPNEYRDEYYKRVEDKLYEEIDSSEIDELFARYLQVQEENKKKAEQSLKEAFSWIIDHWWSLWD